MNLITIWWKRLTNPVYLDWGNYKAKADFVGLFYWSQGVRKENLKNGSSFNSMGCLR